MRLPPDAALPQGDRLLNAAAMRARFRRACTIAAVKYQPGKSLRVVYQVDGGAPDLGGILA